MGYDKFEELCRIHNTNPSRVSKSTGIATATLTSWKKGDYVPKVEKLQRIADFFGVSVDLFYRSEESQSVIDRVTAEFNAPGTTDERDQYYFNLFRQDREFWETIRKLYFLPDNQKKALYSMIRGQELLYKEDKKDGQSSKSSKVG